jgi:hypothetical protein
MEATVSSDRGASGSEVGALLNAVDRDLGGVTIRGEHVRIAETVDSLRR